MSPVKEESKAGLPDHHLPVRQEQAPAACQPPTDPPALPQRKCPQREVRQDPEPVLVLYILVMPSFIIVIDIVYFQNICYLLLGQSGG